LLRFVHSLIAPKLEYQIVKTLKTQTTSRLQLLHGGDIGGLDVVLIRLNLLLQLIERDLLVLNDQVDLELLDTVTDGDKSVRTPDETL
jgi:hypothetical protein